jgi:hypothetical protein
MKNLKTSFFYSQSIKAVVALTFSFGLVGCSSQISEFKRKMAITSPPDESCEKTNTCVSVPPGKAAGNIVMPNYTNAQDYFRDSLELPKSPAEFQGLAGKASALSQPDVVSARDNVPTVVVSSLITNDTLFAYQKYAIAACTDFVNLKIAGKSSVASGSITFPRNFNDASSSANAEAWSSYVKELAKTVWGKKEISAEELNILDTLRSELVSKDNTNFGQTAVFMCSAILLSPASLVN